MFDSVVELQKLPNDELGAGEFSVLLCDVDVVGCDLRKVDADAYDCPACVDQCGGFDAILVYVVWKLVVAVPVELNYQPPLGTEHVAVIGTSGGLEAHPSFDRVDRDTCCDQLASEFDLLPTSACLPIT
nr:hypothetical protein [Rhodococcus opacus]